MPYPNVSRITLDELADLLENFQPTQVVDLGSAMLHVGVNLYSGPVLLINTVCGKAARVKL
jgi:hypothetical protein